MKFNEKQKKLLKIYATIIFAVVLVLVLNTLFNKNRQVKKYVGTWTIGYKFYEDNNIDLDYTFTQTLKLNKDMTFSTEEKTEPEKGLKSFVSGEYEIDGNKIILTYNQYSKKKTDTLIFNDGKLCTELSCDHYYTQDKKTTYFDIKPES